MVARQIRRDQDFLCAPIYFAGVLGAIGPAAFDLVVCNMISEHFLPMAGSLRKLMATRGTAVFSGILESEAEEVTGALEETGFRLLSVRRLDEWVAFRVTHEE
jgi:ribosomal protein L11 methylase PrmA